MGQQLELAKKRLFDKESLGVTNLKLFPGSNRDTTADQFAEQINKAISQIESGDYVMVNLDTEAKA
jgi:predicted Mrr-cat superfamily restriction endonuclease